MYIEPQPSAPCKVKWSEGPILETVLGFGMPALRSRADKMTISSFPSTLIALHGSNIVHIVFFADKSSFPQVNNNQRSLVTTLGIRKRHTQIAPAVSSASIDSKVPTPLEDKRLTSKRSALLATPSQTPISEEGPC